MAWLVLNSLVAMSVSDLIQLISIYNNIEEFCVRRKNTNSHTHWPVGKAPWCKHFQPHYTLPVTTVLILIYYISHLLYPIPSILARPVASASSAVLRLQTSIKSRFVKLPEETFLVGAFNPLTQNKKQ